MTRGKRHPPELRAQVVAAIMSGTGVREAARQFGVDPTMASRWVQAGVATIAAQEKERDLHALVVEYLVTGFRAMINQAEVFGDPAYCRTQSANDLAISHGVLGDKLAGVAATAQALGLVGAKAAAAADDRAAESRELAAAQAPEAT